MENQIILFGKYNGLSFQELIDKDLNYCKFLLSFKFTNAKNEDLIKFLREREDIINKKILEKKLEYVKKTFG